MLHGTDVVFSADMLDDLRGNRCIIHTCILLIWYLWNRYHIDYDVIL